jgi:hypothetical protein
MKIYVSCSRCAHEGRPTQMYPLEFRDDSRYSVPCPVGHHNVIILNAQKFELLFDIGAHAILDNYYREAVSSFTASLERTYEFFIKACFFERNSEQAAEVAWRKISNQSERQLGAFIVLHSYETGTLPALLRDKDVQFRNEVIHKGRIPSRAEAVAYGTAVLEVIRSIVSEVRNRYPNGMLKTILAHNVASRRPDDPKDLIAGFQVGTIVSLSVTGEEHNSRPFPEALRILELIRQQTSIYG